MSPSVQRRALMMRTLWCAVDVIIWIVALYVAVWLRLDFELDPEFAEGTAKFAAVAVLGQIIVGHLLGPYGVGHLRGSFEEVIDLGITASIVTAGLFLWALLSEPVIVPRGVPLTAAAISLILMFAVRFVVRTARVHSAIPGEETRRVIIFGAGEAGHRLLRAMLRDRDSGYQPVALLDDDRAKARLRMEGIRVRGTRANIAAVAEKYQADTLVLAVPNAEAGLLRELAAKAADANIDVLSLPPLKEIIGGRPTTADLRDLDVADLLGRRPVRLDTTVIAEQISGRTVLVTGAGGSIGSELCRQIVRFGPAKLYLLDRDESGLQATQMSLTGTGLLDSDEVILADIRDLDTMRTVFESTRPDLVFHAAALKHLPLLEAYPLEAWKSNVQGTLNVLTAAAQVGVGTFVNISTDKAANPTCVLGYSKRMAERITADFARREPGRYVSVRFGNVLGSRGSVVHAFTAQIERGGPVTVTHPDVERFFMLIPEACQLVLEAAAIGTDGEVMVLDMGEQVKIVEVAETMIRMSGRRDVDIVYTGLRPGEKLAEELFSSHEGRRETSHPLVDSVDVPHIESEQVRGLHFKEHSNAASWMRAGALVGQSEAADSQSGLISR